MSQKYYDELPKNLANYASLSPLSFIKRTAKIYPDHPAIIYENIKRSWSETYIRSKKLAKVLKDFDIHKGDTIAVMLPNIPQMIECHFGIPMLGAVINTLNYRIEPEQLTYCLKHGKAKLLIVDTLFNDLVAKALTDAEINIPIINVIDDQIEAKSNLIGKYEYEALINDAEEFQWSLPSDELDAIALNYTSGTTGRPKGVVYHHRGSYLNSLSNIIDWGMPKYPVYLWTLPMFHCNGWCFTWALAAQAGVNICLRDVRIDKILSAFNQYNVDHYCGAPIVHSMIMNAGQKNLQKIKHKIKAYIAGAAPPIALIEDMQKFGFEFTHIYGLTETYGPSAQCIKHDSWLNHSIEHQAELNSRQGFNSLGCDDMQVLDPRSLELVPADAKSQGEIMFRGNLVMKGYFRDKESTDAAFAGGWLHSGDIAVIDHDQYVKIIDRKKDIIISGGENISSIEIENVLSRHTAVFAVAVVAKSDKKWGEVPCAFVELKVEKLVCEQELINYCRKFLAGFKLPKKIIFETLPRNSTGKILKYKLKENLV